MITQIFRMLCLLAACSIGALAATITVNPSTQTVPIGAPASVDVDVSELGAFSPPSLSTFDIDVGFDPAVLAFSSATFGTGLDLFAFGLNLQFVTPGVGSVNVFELSFDLPGDLDAFQADAFTLFTLNFDAIGGGTSAISLGVNAFGNSSGGPLPVTSTDGSITSTPEPSTIVLVLAGLLLAGRRRFSATR